MPYHGYQGQTGHHEPYAPYPAQWATHPSTYGLPSWDHTYRYHQRVTHGLYPYAPPGQCGESAWSGAPLATAEYEARRYGHLQGVGGVGVATIPVYGADPYTPHQTMAHCAYNAPPRYQQASLPRYGAVTEFVRSERTMPPHSQRSMARAQITPGIDHIPWRLSEVEAMKHNTYTFNNGYSVERSTAAQPFAEDVLVSVAGPSTSWMLPVPASSTTHQAKKSKGTVMEWKSAGGAKGRTQASAKTQILGMVAAKEKRTMPPGDGPWICHVEGQEYARYWEMLRHKETTKGHDEYKGPCICVCGAEFTRTDAKSRHYKQSCPLRSKRSSRRR